jgi:uncharacterized MAPEG superfamily protein
MTAIIGFRRTPWDDRASGDEKRGRPRRRAGMEMMARPPAAWKSVAIPVEHGGWGFLAEPVALGLLIAPSAAGACLALSALAAFLARHPLRLVWLDRRRDARYPRTVLAERFLLGYASLAALLVAAGLSRAVAPVWPALAAATPLGLGALALDARGRSRDALAETFGATALSSAVAAIALAGGAAPALAWGAWALLAARAVVSILYVRARIRLDRGLPAGPGVAVLAHLGALALAVALARSASAPWLAPGAFLVLLARAAWGLRDGRATIRPRTLGFQELGFGLLTLVVLAVGYRFGP